MLINSAVHNTFSRSGFIILPFLFQLFLPVHSSAAIPATLKSAVEANRHLLVSHENALIGENAEQQFALRFERNTVAVLTKGSEVRLRLDCYGRGSELKAAGIAVAKASGNRADYQRDDLDEWYINSAAGLEQGFTLASPPSGSGSVRLTVAVEGGFLPHIESSDALLLMSEGKAVARYSGLKAWDADGRILNASMKVRGNRIQLIIDDANAMYPVTIDPILQQAKLTAPDGLAGDDFGYAVAVNGTTALVGAFGKADFTGAAYVYVQNGTTWTEQAKLTASDGATFNNFGSTVALSGNTALIGAFENSGSLGAAYVFVRNGTTWTQQAKLKATKGNPSDEFGYSVSLDGNTAVIGALQANSLAGAAYVFTRSGTAWKQQAELTASNGAPFDGFGNSVAVSGTIAVIGSRSHASNGAAYVFVQSGTTWTQQAELTAADGAAFDEYGSAVAANGTTVIIGARSNNNALGAAYVYTQSGTTWPLQTKLMAVNGAAGDEFGFSVSVSGNVALIGAPFQGVGTGSAYFFIRSGVVWQEQAKLNASDYALYDQFGQAVSFSGNIGLVGAPFKANSMGASYIYTVPLVTPTPAVGNPASMITVAGSDFLPNETVYIVWAVPHAYLGSATADGTGSFSGFQVTVPAGATTGFDTFYASGATSKNLAIGYFTVQ